MHVCGASRLSYMLTEDLEQHAWPIRRESSIAAHPMATDCPLSERRPGGSVFIEQSQTRLRAVERRKSRSKISSHIARAAPSMTPYCASSEPWSRNLRRLKGPPRWIRRNHGYSARHGRRDAAQGPPAPTPRSAAQRSDQRARDATDRRAAPSQHPRCASSVRCWSRSRIERDPSAVASISDARSASHS